MSGFLSSTNSGSIFYKTAGTYSFTVPTGINCVLVTAIAGGGGGGAGGLGETNGNNAPYVTAPTTATGAQGNPTSFGSRLVLLGGYGGTGGGGGQTYNTSSTWYPREGNAGVPGALAPVTIFGSINGIGNIRTPSTDQYTPGVGGAPSILNWMGYGASGNGGVGGAGTVLYTGGCGGCGASGASGVFISQYPIGVTPGEVITITIGSGGTGGVAPTGTGNLGTAGLAGQNGAMIIEW